MERHVSRLRKLGFVKRVTSPGWVSAPVTVPKRAYAKFWLTVDYCKLTKAAVTVVWSKSSPGMELTADQSATVFANMDFGSGYRQLPLHVDSQSYF